MTETKNAHEGVVASIADTDLVMVVGPQGGLHPIPFADLAKLVRNSIQIGGRNLIKGSRTPVTSIGVSFYLNLSDPITPDDAGKSYTMSYKYEYANVTTGNSYQSKRFYLYLIIDNKELPCSVYLPENSNGLSGKGYAKATVQIPAFAGDPVSMIRAIVQLSSGSVKMYDFKLERGNVATDWTPAPEDIASGTWGGVIGYLPITYNSTIEESKKGGAHEPDERTIGCAEVSADGLLAFGSLDDMCRFIGSIQETGAGSNIDLSIPRLQCERAERHRHISSCFGFDELPIKSKWKLMLRNGWSRWCDTEFLPIRRRRLFVQKVQSRVYLEELDARITNRKEVAV